MKKKSRRIRTWDGTTVIGRAKWIKDLRRLVQGERLIGDDVLSAEALPKATRRKAPTTASEGHH